MLLRLRRLALRLWPWRRDPEIAEEIATHLAMATRDRIARGESPEGVEGLSEVYRPGPPGTSVGVRSARLQPRDPAIRRN